MDRDWSFVVFAFAEAKPPHRRILPVQLDVPFSRVTKGMERRSDLGLGRFGSPHERVVPPNAKFRGLAGYFSQHLGIGGKFFEER